MIHLAIFSPIPALRAGLRALLSGDPELNVLLTAASLRAKSSLEVETHPGVDGGLGAEPLLPPELGVIIATPGGVDFSAEGVNGLAAAGPRLADLALLFISDEITPEDLRRLSGLGLRAWGVIPPEATSEALQAAIRALAEGLTVFSNEVWLETLAATFAGPAGGLGEGAARDGAVSDGALNGAADANQDEAGGPVERLTERESDVLRQVAQGLTNKQIALALKISEHTVKFHVSSIYSKLGVSNRTEAVRKGARLGWIPL